MEERKKKWETYIGCKQSKRWKAEGQVLSEGVEKKSLLKRALWKVMEWIISFKETEKQNSTSKRWINCYGNGNSTEKVKWIWFKFFFLFFIFSLTVFRYITICFVILVNPIYLPCFALWLFLSFVSFIMFGVFIRWKKSKIYGPIKDTDVRFCDVCLTYFIGYSKCYMLLFKNRNQLETHWMKNLTLYHSFMMIIYFILFHYCLSLCDFYSCVDKDWNHSSFWDCFTLKKFI